MTVYSLIAITDESGILPLTCRDKAEDALFCVARALSLDPRFSQTRFMIRSTSPEEASLYVISNTTEQVHLENLVKQLRWADYCARYITYKEAEGLTEILAEKLIKEYGPEELRSFAYTAIPRGGHIVMGMLSYCLGLPKSALLPKEDSNRPIVYVDDCLISGLRSGEYMKPKEGPSILALLLAPEVVCGMSGRGELPFTCWAAEEREDIAPALLGEEYEGWKSRHKNESRLWSGIIEYFAFEWSEPESSFINLTTGKVEPGFNLLPPALCLGSRRKFPGTPRDPQVHRD